MSLGFRLVADLQVVLDTLHIAKLGIGPESDLWITAYDWLPAQALPGEPDWTQVTDLTVLHLHQGTLRSAIAVPHAGKRSFVQPLGMGGVLLVAAGTSGEPNARVVDAAGATLRDFMLGDGIEDVQTTASGDIWVSYNDQGTFVGCWRVDWISPSAHLSHLNAAGQLVHGDGTHNEHYGLLRASAEGTVEWRFTDSPGIEPILWCDGLNVLADGEEVWASYSVFPNVQETSRIVRINADGERQLWWAGDEPYQALAVHGDTIALFARYGERPTFVLGRLGDHHGIEDLRPLADLAIGRDEPVWVLGRGAVLHCIQGTRWYILDLRD